MGLRAVGGDIDPTGWAQKPRSQMALDAIRRGAQQDSRMGDILEGHKAAGVCDQTGQNLLLRWNGSKWKKQERL